ncbi:Ribonuclease P protein component [Limimaricola hongkongensis DSM 17492]|uniref:Ribonuclease P protein component n=1 Tax=Limimaricola hongkongensis DSM 17492 TaxID=1122180 RepID=A0A017HGJ2_9RHOB|nr:Ribonuclease P protein component [Limimaricola hongkongensis DSM 17492]
MDKMRKRPDFLRAARALRQGTTGFHLQGNPRDDGSDAVRVGFTCSKKVGNAVARNRAKRRLREVARKVLPERGRAGWDYVLIGRAEVTATHDIEQMARDLEWALGRVHRQA